MLPQVVESLIFAYLEELNNLTSLPSKKEVAKLISLSNRHVLDCLGFVLRMSHTEVAHLHYRLVIEKDFYFHFRLGLAGRAKLLYVLNRAAFKNLYCSNLVWIFIHGKPDLMQYQDYAQMFSESLLCRTITKLR